MKNGLIQEGNEWIYYKDDTPYHAGAVSIDGAIYYIGRGGRAVTGVHIVHREMCNDLLKHGTYTFDEDGRLVEGSYIPPKKLAKSKKKKKRSKTRRSSKTKLSKKEKRRLWISVAVAAVLAVTVAVTAIVKSIGPSSAVSTTTSDSKAVILPQFEEEIVLCTKQAAAFDRGEATIEEAITGGQPYAAVEFRYDLLGASGMLSVSESPSMSNAREYVMSANSELLTLNNLKTGTTYYYTVEVGEDTHTGSFKTAAGTRYVSMPGAENTRDIGGVKTSDGHTLRQGMIIRGTELDGLENAKYLLKTDAVDETMETFGFVCDFDLRSESVFIGENYQSRLGDEVHHRFYDAPMYGSVFGSAYKQSVRQIFSDLAKPANYPMYMHCTFGVDRTGTLVFLLQGILGVPEDEMLREYRRSAYTFREYADNDYMDGLIAGLALYEGDTIHQQIENFLVNGIGVTKDEIAAIRSILLE